MHLTSPARLSAPIYFLADVHLSEAQDAITQAFTQTITLLTAQQPQAVFILGDLFNYYLGDTLITPYQRHIAKHLHTLSAHTPLFYQHGNRDFLLNQTYARLSGLTLLPERYSFTLPPPAPHLPPHQLLLEHGDLLCRDDHGYQRLRKFLRHPLTQRLYHHLSPALKHRLARYLRQQSQQRGQYKSPSHTDVTPDYIDTLFKQHHANILIHGHTHRPQIHHHPHGIRYVLGDWHPHGKILCYHHGKFCLLESHELI